MAAELAPMWSRLGSLILESGRRDKGSRIHAEQNLNERVITRSVTLAPVSHPGHPPDSSNSFDLTLAPVELRESTVIPGPNGQHKCSSRARLCSRAVPFNDLRAFA